MKVGDTHPYPRSLSPPFLSCNPHNLADFKFRFYLLSNGITIVHWSLQHWERTPGFTHDRHVLYQMTIPWTLTVTSLSVYSSLFRNTIIHHMTAFQVHWWNTDNGRRSYTSVYSVTSSYGVHSTDIHTNEDKLTCDAFLKTCPHWQDIRGLFLHVAMSKKRFYIKNILGGS